MRRKVIFQTVSLDDEYDVDAAETVTDVLTTGATLSQLSDIQRINAGLNLTDDILNISVARGPTTETINSSHQAVVDDTAYSIIRINKGNRLSREIVFTIKRVD